METTKVNNETINVLQELLQKNYDAEAGYKQVMTKTENAPLKGWLQSKAHQRSVFATELDHKIRELHGEPVKDGSILGSAHRAWIDIKTAVSSDTDEAILVECIRGEKASIDEYKTQLEKVRSNTEINHLLQNQLINIKTALNTVARLEDITD